MSNQFEPKSERMRQASASRNNTSAALDDNWGVRWASVAAEAGVQAAADAPLPKNDEAEARRFALSFTEFTPEMRAYARVQADAIATLAVDSFRAVLSARETAGNAASPLKHQAKGDTAMDKAETWGRAAARAQRTLTLLAEMEGAQ